MSEWAVGHSVRPVVPIEDMDGPAVILPCDQYPRGAIVPRKEPGMFEVPDGGLSAIAENRKNNRGLPGRLRSTNIHSEPDIVNRLIRMVEELIERDDLTPDADPTWYRNRLREIKEEVASAQDTGERGSSPSGETSEQASAEGAH